MTESLARQPKGIPAGGQFAHTAHAEPDVALPARRPELEGWPESLPEPEVELTLNDDGSLTTTVKIDGVSAFEAWNPQDDPFSTDSGGWVHEAVTDDAAREQAEEWVRNKHDEMVAGMRRDLRATFERTRAGIVAQATGKPEPMDQAQLENLITANTRARAAIERDTELASAALAAQKILAEHPTAEYAKVLTDSWDNGELVAGARVVDADGNELHTYEDWNADPHGPGWWPVVELVKNLSPNAAQSHWSGAFAAGSYGDEMSTIDLRKAAAWTPGATA